MYYDTIIIGGGASGLCTAIKSKKDNNKVLIIEHNLRVGKKILSTGNGKCNLTNSYCTPSLFDKNDEGLYPYFPYSNKDFAEKVIGAFDCNAALEWFRSIGLLFEDKDGYIYPLSEQASSVLDALRFEASSVGVDIITDYQPIEIRYSDGQFIIDDEYRSKNLVVACGGASAPKSGSDGSGYEYAKSFGHKIIEPIPALCGIKCSGRFFKELKGVRCDAVLKVYARDTEDEIIKCRGNVQLNEYGVSGIPAMQISSTVGRLLASGRELYINISLLPEIDFKELSDILYENLKRLVEENREELPIGMLLNGILNKKLISVLMKELGLNFDIKIKDALERFRNSKEYDKGLVCAKDHPQTDDIRIFSCRLAGLIKHFKSEVVGVCGFDEAQTTSGGVSVDEIDPNTMMSKLIPGLFFTGEIVDVDGICGGYNLQWAWASAHIAALNQL